MDLIKNYIYPFILTISLGCIFSIVHAEEKLQATAYLCLDNEVILTSETLQERVNSTKQFLANTTLLITDGELLFFRTFYRNKGLFFGPTIDKKLNEFRALTFKDATVALSIKSGDDIQNERYLCEANSELTNLINSFDDNWPNHVIK